jgi:hypothetical protein
MLTPKELGAVAALAAVAAALTIAGPAAALTIARPAAALTIARPAAALTIARPAAAAPRPDADGRDRGAVFAQTDSPAGIAIAVCDRGPDGALSPASPV